MTADTGSVTISSISDSLTGAAATTGSREEAKGVAGAVTGVDGTVVGVGGRGGGDCTGIGPEQTARILADGNLATVARLVVVGDARVLVRGMRDAKVDFAWTRVEGVAGIDRVDHDLHRAAIGLGRNAERRGRNDGPR